MGSPSTKVDGEMREVSFICKIFSTSVVKSSVH